MIKYYTLNSGSFKDSTLFVVVDHEKDTVSILTKAGDLRCDYPYDAAVNAIVNKTWVEVGLDVVKCRLTDYGIPFKTISHDACILVDKNNSNIKEDWEININNKRDEIFRKIFG